MKKHLFEWPPPRRMALYLASLNGGMLAINLIDVIWSRWWWCLILCAINGACLYMARDMFKIQRKHDEFAKHSKACDEALDNYRHTRTAEEAQAYLDQADAALANMDRLLKE